METIRKQIEGHTPIRDKVSSFVDLPRSNECKHVLSYAAEEAERLSHMHIGTEHLLLGLLREEKCFATEILHERGLRLSSIREELARTSQENAQQAQRSRESSLLLAEFSRDLTQSAMDNQFDPVVGRDQELASVIEILCRRDRSNPLLVGEPGFGTTAIVEGLAQRIADGEVPSFLADKRILAIDRSLIVAGIKDRDQFEGRLKTITNALMESQNSIIFIDELQTWIGARSQEASTDVLNILRPALSKGEIQCIGAITAIEYSKFVEPDRSLERVFQSIKVPPPSEADSVKILFGNKERYEKFHAVTYTDEAINFSVAYANRYFPDRYLPGKAMEILDEAGTRVKVRQTSLPEDITEVQKRIKFIVHRMENAIANHEFEKARFYSDEERKGRDNLRALREKYHLDEAGTGVVGREEIEDVVSRLTGLSVDSLRIENLGGTQIDAFEQPTEPRPSGSVFISYSHKDKKWLELLLEHLAPLGQMGIDIWTDKEILPGEYWSQEIEKRLVTARVAILLVTPSFLSSPYVVSHELPKLLTAAKRKGLVIFWIPVIASSYKETDIAQFQAALDPSKPLKTFSSAKRAELLVSVAEKLSRYLVTSKSTSG